MHVPSQGRPRATGETILRCNDSGGNPNIEILNYMVCATSYADATEQCWFCGDDFGAPAGIPAAPLGTVGDFDGGAGSWTATDEFANCTFLD